MTKGKLREVFSRRSREFDGNYRDLLPVISFVAVVTAENAARVMRDLASYSRMVFEKLFQIIVLGQIFLVVNQSWIIS